MARQNRRQRSDVKEDQISLILELAAELSAKVPEFKLLIPMTAPFDLALFVPRGRWHGLFVMIPSRNGRLSRGQREWRERFQ